jgi:DNA-directed RNA polymerase specialized sigma subunit
VKVLQQQTKAIKERCIENHLRFFKTYLVGIKNCEQQLEYIMPSLVARYEITDSGESLFIINNTENVALDRIEGKRALDLREEIEKNKLITSSIENAINDLKQQEKDFVEWRYFECLPMHEVKLKLGYSEEKSVYRIRRHVLDKLLISLKNLLSF